MNLDKWQERQAEQYAAENGVSYDQAVTDLFIGAAAEAPAPVVTNPAEAADPGAGDVSLTK